MTYARVLRGGLAAILVSLAVPAAAGPVVFSAAGPDAASILATVNAFRAELGNPNNGVTPGSQPTGRREITWDGGGGGAPATPFASPMIAFANRGNVYTTPGTGFEISGLPLPEFGEINPTYPDIFTTFSSPRLFAVLGSTVTDVHFTIPGTTNVPGFASGFGAVFTDVDIAGATTIEFFRRSGASLGVFPVLAANEGLSFLGVSFGEAKIARARIVTGNAALGPNDGPGVDVVVMDDFIFGEPQAVPEPGVMALLALGAGAVVRARRGRRSI